MGKVALDRLLVIDIEATCWDCDVPEGQVSEPIEIGIAEAVFSPAPRLARQASWLVRPARSSVSGFCTGLTGITGADLKRARPLGEVVATMRREFGGAGKAWAGWGRDDTSLVSACREAGVQPPEFGSFLDLGAAWAMLVGSAVPVSLDRAVASVGAGFRGRRHRALPDAVATAEVALALSTAVRALAGVGGSSQACGA